MRREREELTRIPLFMGKDVSLSLSMSGKGFLFSREGKVQKNFGEERVVRERKGIFTDSERWRKRETNRRVKVTMYQHVKR